MAEPVVVATSRNRRRRQADTTLAPVDAWPPTWRTLTARWLRRASPRAKWDTLLATAGGEGFETAYDVLAALLAGGWIAVDETWRGGRWQPAWIDFLDLPALRRTLGIPEPGAVKAAQDTARAELLAALECWTADENRPAQATRRDFALFARGDTKGITAAEWEWLETQADLAVCGIGEHTPLFCIAAPLALLGPGGRVDLGTVPDFLGLSPATLESAAEAESMVRQWTLVENRTSFERLARARQLDEGVLWLPGYPPDWWQIGVARLIRLARAPARIACDPDPAGIEIALTAGRLWEDASLAWQPWRMEANNLADLPVRKPLTERDRAHLATLLARPLPPALRTLAENMVRSGEKGEQEGYL
jgi:hypothetical protein